MNSLIVAASLNSMSVTAAIDNRFLNPLAMLCGAEATVGYPIPKQTAAKLATPAKNFSLRSSGLMSRMAGAKMVPESYTCSTCRPYEKGDMFNMFRRVASEAPTLSPGFRMWTSLMISIVPL